MKTRAEEGRPQLTVLPALSLDAFDRRFPDDNACKQYLADVRWPDGPRCARCDNEKVYAVKGRPFTWVCKKCGKTPYRFSVLVGTVFKDTKMPLRAWFKVAYLMLSSKKGMSALQVYRMMARTHGADYRTYWFMCMRLRAAMQNGEFEQLVGKVVEIDETFIGGKQANRHANVRAKYSGRGAADTGKVTVIGAIARKGNVVAQVIENTSAETLSLFVEKTIADNVTLIATDEYAGYTDLKHFYPHETVHHRSGEYVRGNVHTNNIENFWSLLKRGVMGTFHNVSKDYLPLYLNEFTFRHNFRHEPDQFRQLISSVHQKN